MASELMNRITERARQMKAEREEAGWDPRRSDVYNRIVQNIRNGGFLTNITDAEAKRYFEDVKSYARETGQKLTAGSWSDVMDPTKAADRESQNKSLTDKGYLIRQWAGTQRQSRGDEWYNSMMKYLDDFDRSRQILNQDFSNFQRYYSQWESQEAYDEYIDYINSEKYQDDLLVSAYKQQFTNMSKTEIDTVMASLPEGEVKEQLQDYRNAVLRNTDDYEQEIGERAWEIGRLQGAYDRLEFLSTQPVLEDSGAKEEDSPELKALKEEYELYKKNYGSTGEISARIANLSIEKYNLEKGMQYDLLYQNADFEEKSKYNGGGSNTQVMVNNPDSAENWDTFKTIASQPIEPTTWTIAKLADAFGYENLHLMEDPERKIYNYLYNTRGEDAADEYLDWLQLTLNARSQQNSMKWVAERTRDVPVLSQIYTSLLSTPLKFMSGEALLDVAGQKAYNYVTGSDRPIDYNRDAFFYGNAGNTIRSTVAQDINTATGGPIELDVDEHPFLASVLNGKGVGDIYSLAMSAQDSSVVAAATAINPVAGAVANAMLSTSAATDAMVAAVNNGATDGQAFTVGLAAGFFEYFFEKYEVGSLMKQGKNVVTATLKQALSEALGESATELSNLVVNTYVLAENSDYEKNIEKYLREHPDWTEERARKQAFMDAIGQVLSAFASGFFSGGVMGAAYSSIQNVGDNIYTKRADTGIAEGLLQSDGGMSRLKELATEVAEENASKRLEKNIERFDKNPTVKNTRKLYRSVADSYAIQDQGDVVKSLKRKGFSDSEASTLASALIAESTGTAVEEDGAKLLQKYIGDSRIQETRKQILENTKSTVAQRQDKLDGLQYESALGAIETELKKTKTRTDMAETAFKRFAELGETTADIDALAEAAAKSAAGEKLTSAEKKLLKGSEYSTQVVQELKEATAKPVAEVTAAETTAPDTTSTSTETTAPAETTASETALDVSTDGVTIQKSTGVAVQIKEVASIKNGKMTLRMEDGSEVDAGDISFGSEAEAMIYETVAKLGIHPKAANLLVDAFYTANVPALDYTKGIIEAHGYGRHNFSEQDMMNNGSFAKKLTPHQRKMAYEAGQIFGGRETAREHAAVRRPKNSKESIKEGKVHFDGDRSKLNDTQKASLDVMEMLSKALGVQIYIFESATDTDGKHTGKNGWYDLRDGSIHIDLNAGLDGKGTMLFTAAHELTHFIRQWSPAKFKVLANFLISRYYDKGVSVQELIDGQIAKAKRDGRTLDRDAAYEEVVADSMETMLTDGNVLQQLAELQQRDKTLWEKIRGWFKDFANKLKAVIKAYDGAKPDSVEGRLVSDMQGVVEILEALYVDALTDASANYGTRAQKNTAGGGVKYSIVALDDGRVYVKASRNIITGSTKSDQRRNITDFFNSLLDGQPSLDIYTIEGDILTISKAQTAKKARDDYKSVGGTPVKMTDSEFAVKMHIEAHIDEIAEVSRSSNQKSDTKNHAFAQSGFTYRRAYFEDFDGQYYEITLSIGNNGSIATVYNVGKIDKSVPPSAKIIAVVGSKALGGTLSKNSIRNSSGVVNQKFSVCDSKGNQLSEAQQNFFRDSKIRDKEGRLLVLYHQTDGDFTIFDTRHTGAGSNDGGTPFGIFLKRSPADIGLSGKKQMALYANITNPLRATNREDLDRQLRKISGRYAAISDRVKNLDVEYQRKIDQAQTAWNDYVKKWREANPNAKRTDLYGDPKFNELFDAEDDLADEWTTVSDRLSVQAKEVITEDLRKAGHDGIFLEEDMGSWGRRTDAIIALDPKQVKDTSNQNPTDNPDIRYSTRDPATQKLQQALEKENARLKEDITYLKELLALQRKVTGGTKFTKSSVTAAAQMLKKNANAKGDTKELATLLNTFYEYIATEKELTWEGVKEQAQAPVQWLQDHVNLKPQRSEYAREVLQQIRGSRIYLDESQKAEAAHRFGSFNDFRKSVMGSVIIVKDGNTSLDSFWQEMSATYPDIFSRETASGDMPGELFEIIGRLRNSDTSRVEYEYNRDSIAMDLLQQVYDSYWRVSNLRTATDSAQKKINVLRFKHNEQMSKLRAEKNAKIDSLKAEYRAELDKVRKEHKADTEAKVQDIRDKYTSARERAIDSRKRMEMRQKIRKDIRDLTKMLKRGKDEQNVKEEMKELASATLAQAEALFIDYYTDNDIIRNGTGLFLPSNLSAMMNEAHDILKRLDDPPYDVASGDAEAMAAWFPEQQRLENRLNALKSKLKEVFIEERNRMGQTTAAELMNSVFKAYEELVNSDKEYIRNAYDYYVLEHLRGIKDRFGNVKARDMSLRQLEDLHKAYTMVLHTIRNANKAFTESRSVEQLAKTLVSELKGQYKVSKKQLANMARNAANLMGWNYEKLHYALERVGSETLTRLFNNLANSENTVMQDVIEAKEKQLELIDKYGYNDWKVNEQIDKDFMDSRGKSFRMTLGEMMLLYAYVRRGSMDKQLEFGGFVFGEKALMEQLKETDTANTYKLTREQCISITNTLSEKQKNFVADMQTFLSETMGAKGNEVSMMLYGVELFTEQNYMPSHVAGEYLSRAEESKAKKEAGFGTMKNAGFTNSKNVEAKAPIVLESFMDVWVDHVNEMSRYHGTVPALEDIRRVMNYSVYNDANTDSVSVKATLENSHGKNAVNYFDSLYREANSGAVMDKLQGFSRQALAKMRKLSVAYSLSVIVQQPASLVRAYAMIDKKYFGDIRIPGLRGRGTLPVSVAKTALNRLLKTQTKAYGEMLKYAPGVTMAKEIGGFDTASGSSIRTYLMDTEKSLKQKLKTGTAAERVKAVTDMVDDNPVANVPNLADKMTWIEIWNACKRETAAKHKYLDVGSEAFMQKVGQRFTEVIRATQVYDSMFAKSPMLKSKNAAVQYVVSFMNEPNVVVNMVESAVRDFRQGNRRQAARKLTAVARSIIFTCALKSIVYALRDDDEDETFIEKYVQALVSNLIGDFTGFNYIPVVADVWSLFQGYDVERPDIAIFADVIQDIRKYNNIHNRDVSDMTPEELDEWERDCTSAGWSLVGSIAGCFGIPVKNVTREVKTVFNVIDMCGSNTGDTTWETIKDAAWQGIADELPGLDEEKSTDKLYQAITEGDQAYLERLKQGYMGPDGKIKERKYTTAIRKGLRENDSRIQDAAKARMSMDTDEYLRIVDDIVADGYFSEDDVVAAVRSEYNSLKGDDVSTQLYNAVASGDDETTEELKGSFINDKGKFSEESFQNAICNGLRENEPRIQTAAEAKAAGDTGTYLEIVEEIVDEGHFKWKDVSAAVKDEVKEMSE